MMTKLTASSTTSPPKMRALMPPRKRMPVAMAEDHHKGAEVRFPQQQGADQHHHQRHRPEAAQKLPMSSSLRVV
jgi:hypothetical protein